MALLTAVDTQSTTTDVHDQLEKKFFQSLLAASNYAAIMIDTNGNVLTWNSGAENLYRYKAGDIIGKNFYALFTNRHNNTRQAADYLATAKREGYFEITGLRYRQDGSTYYALDIFTPLYLHNNGIVQAYTLVTHNITTQKKLEDENRLLNDSLEEKVNQRTRELAIVNKELEAFSYSVSHDLRTPLRAICGFSMILKEDYEHKLDEEGNRVIDTVIDNAKIMGQLIDDLLSFSKMSRLEVIYDSIDMNSLAEWCVKDLHQNTNYNKNRVHINHLPMCKGDPNMLKQVWYNLIANAFKYSSKKAEPIVEIGYIDNELNNIYFVKDNGAGFDMRYASKLFGVFQRLHGNDEFEGTGLGLALSKRIITKHLGEIWATSVLNEEAIFYFSIPKNIENEQKA